jgi:hypothetical protein
MPDTGEPSTRDTRLHRQARNRRRYICTIAVAAAFGLGYLVADFEHTTVNGFMRVGSSVALVLLFEEIRLGRGLARIERQLESRLKEAIYAEGYVDGLQRRPPDDGERHLRSV